MILQALNELYGRLEKDPDYGISPPGFSPQKISFRVVIKEDGSLFAIEDARSPNEKGKLDANPVEVPQHEKRTSGVKAQFMCDKLEYTLGYQPSGKKAGTGDKCFNAFKEKHLDAEIDISSPSYKAFCSFLRSWTPKKLEEHQISRDLESGFGVFQILGNKTDIHEDSAIKNWWLNQRTQQDQETSKEQCLVSGKFADICRIHPDIKGFKSSIALVGIQENTSYESYARSKTENCPISEDVAFKYATALNSLLTGPSRSKHRISIANTTAVFWTETPTLIEDTFAEFLGARPATEDAQDISQVQRLRALLEAIKSGQGESHEEEWSTPFFLLGLEQPNPGRFSVRYFYRSTTGDLLKNLHRHHKQIDIVSTFENDPKFPAIWQLLDQIAPPKGKKIDRDKIPPLLGGALTRAIVEGTPYPEGLFTAVIRRIHADRTINYLRAALLKGILFRNHNITTSIMLDPNNTEPAYLLGRLFSALEKTQNDALGDLNAGIRDKYYSSASATPASVFPRLLRTYQHHLAKLNGGAKVSREKLVQEIIDRIASSGFPNQLNLKAQGIFTIGYYHQRKDFFTKKDTSES